MLLEHLDVSVRGGEYRIHSRVIATLSLRSLDKEPNLRSTIFALVTLGDLATNGSVVQAHTAGFQLEEIPGYLTYHGRWYEANATHRFEHGFLDFLLHVLPVHVEFVLEQQRIGTLVVKIGSKVELSGRFPKEVDVLSLHFGAVSAVLN